VLSREVLQINKEVIVGEGVALEHFVDLEHEEYELVRVPNCCFVLLPAGN